MARVRKFSEQIVKTMLIVLAVLFSTVNPVVVKAEELVSNESELIAAVASAQTGVLTEIVVDADFHVSTPILIDNGKKIKITTNGDHTISASLDPGALFAVIEGSELTLGDNGSRLTFVGTDTSTSIYANRRFVRVNGTGSTLVVNNVTFTKGINGAVYLTNDGTVIINDGAIFLENGTYGNDETSFTPTNGGAIYSNDSTLIINGGEFTNNNGKRGGAINVAGHGTGSTVIYNATFTGNNAGLVGGAISLDNADAPMVIYAGTFTNNTTVRDGGAIYVHNHATLDMPNKTIITDNNGNKGGGGVYYCAVGTEAGFITNGALVTRNKTDVSHSSDYYITEGEPGNNNPIELINRTYFGGVIKWITDPGNVDAGQWMPRTSTARLKTEVSDAVFDSAYNNADLIIEGNTSGALGGGLACNGVCTFGTGTNALTLKTYAREKGTLSQQMKPTSSVTIVDTVIYTNLVVGEEYTLVGILMDKGTSSPIQVNGADVTASVTFTPTSTQGGVDVEFTFDASLLDGKTIVVFEKLYDSNSTLVGSHEDINDVDQTITFVAGPTIDISTSAKDKETGTQESNADSSVTIIDTVSYTGLTVGEEYTLVGTLMDKVTKSPIQVNGSNVTATVTFKPTSANGTKDLEFTFDASLLGGKTIVVFEKLYDSTNTLVGRHEDIDDADQTITFPGVSTSAKNKDTGTRSAEENSSVTIIDTVSYTNLIVGEEYTVDGILMDKATSRPLLIGGVNVTATVKFKPTTANGTIDLEFTFDATNLDGTSIVVFERLSDANGELVGSHEDINDANQTVTVTKTKKVPVTPPTNPPKTGVDNGIGMNATILLVAGLTMIMSAKSKKEQSR